MPKYSNLNLILYGKLYKIINLPLPIIPIEILRKIKLFKISYLQPMPKYSNLNVKLCVNSYKKISIHHFQ